MTEAEIMAKYFPPITKQLAELEVNAAVSLLGVLLEHTIERMPKDFRLSVTCAFAGLLLLKATGTYHDMIYQETRDTRE